MKKIKGLLSKALHLFLIGMLIFAGMGQAVAGVTVTYYHTDALGSTVAATDESGNELWRESYRPYGERIQHQVDTSQHSVLYTGKEHDDDTGLTYFGARYYDPNIGRFMGMDPVGFYDSNPQSFNRYVYANNNPYVYIDPDGEFGTTGFVYLVLAATAIYYGYKFLSDVKEKLDQQNTRKEKFSDFNAGNYDIDIEQDQRDRYNDIIDSVEKGKDFNDAVNKLRKWKRVEDVTDAANKLKKMDIQNKVNSRGKTDSLKKGGVQNKMEKEPEKKQKNNHD